jgi:hypothetical protein
MPEPQIQVRISCLERANWQGIALDIVSALALILMGASPLLQGRLHAEGVQRRAEAPRREADLARGERSKGMTWLGRKQKQ